MANTQGWYNATMMIRITLATLLFAACIAGPSTATMSTPKPLPTEIPSGAALVVPLDPAGTPEAMPLLVIRLSIMDEETGEPVRGDVYIVDSFDYREPLPNDQRYASVEDFELALFGDINAWLIVKAPGYETWRIRLSFNLKTSRELTGPVQMRRVQGEGL